MKKYEKMHPDFRNILTASIVHVCMIAKKKKKALENLKIKRIQAALFKTHKFQFLKIRLYYFI